LRKLKAVLSSQSRIQQDQPSNYHLGFSDFLIDMMAFISSISTRFPCSLFVTSYKCQNYSSLWRHTRSKVSWTASPVSTTSSF